MIVSASKHEIYVSKYIDANQICRSVVYSVMLKVQPSAKEARKQSTSYRSMLQTIYAYMHSALTSACSFAVIMMIEAWVLDSFNFQLGI